MKKSVIAAVLLISILALGSVAHAAERQVIGVKGGYNSFICEWEKISEGGTSIFVQEIGYNYDLFATLFGFRKHASLQGNHSYIGAAIGISSLRPVVDAHIGYEFHPSFFPSFLHARAEAGASLIVDWDFDLHPVLHTGIGVGFDFDWSMFF